MLREMSSHQLSEWIAYHNLEPFGDELLDIHLAKFQAMMASTPKDVKDPEKFRLWEKIEKPFDPQEFYDDLKKAFFLD